MTRATYIRRHPDPALAALRVAALAAGFSLSEVRGSSRTTDLTRFRRAVVAHLRGWGWTHVAIGALLDRHHTTIVALAGDDGGVSVEGYGALVARAFGLMPPDRCGCGAPTCYACGRLGFRRAPSDSTFVHCSACGLRTRDRSGVCAACRLACDDCGGPRSCRSAARCWRCPLRASRRPPRTCVDCRGPRSPESTARCGACHRAYRRRLTVTRADSRCERCGGTCGPRSRRCLACYRTDLRLRWATARLGRAS